MMMIYVHVLNRGGRGELVADGTFVGEQTHHSGDKARYHFVHNDFLKSYEGEES